MVVARITSRRTSSHNYTVVLDGKRIAVTVTSTPFVVKKWLEDIMFRYRRHRHRLIVGLGAQWTPTFSSRPEPPAEALQLCVGRHCLIIQVARCHFLPRLLYRFLWDPDNTFVGIWNNQDESKLWETEHRLRVGKLLDLRRYLVTEEGQSLRSASFETIVEEYLGIRGCWLDREISTSNWADEYLTEAQVVQACVKSFVAFFIGTAIKAWELP